MDASHLVEPLMARRLKIGVDIDGVLVDFVSAFLKEAQQVLGREITGKHVTWEFEDSLDITKEEVKKVWKKIQATNNWFLLYPHPLPNISRALTSLVLEHEVYFITSRATTAGYTPQEQSQIYLQGLGVDFPTVIANVDKGELAAALKLDVFIDDNVENVKRVMLKSPKTKVFLRTASYNEKAQGTWLCAENFADFCDKVEELANE